MKSEAFDPTTAVIFLHIPKAAGTTLQQIIDRQYEPGTVFSVGTQAQESIERFKQWSVERRAQVLMVKGHLAFGLHDFLPRPSTYITILRDPIERTLSYYHYVLLTPAHYLHEEVTARNVSLEVMMGQGMTPDLDNGQTRLLSGVWNDVPVGQCTTEMLELAKKNLRESFRVVGLAERFDESLILLRRAFGWRRVYYVKANVTANRPKRETVSDEVIEAIKTYNNLDLALYHHVQQLFDDEVSRAGVTFAAELLLFRLLNYARSASNSQSIEQPDNPTK